MFLKTQPMGFAEGLETEHVHEPEQSIMTPRLLGPSN